MDRELPSSFHESRNTLPEPFWSSNTFVQVEVPSEESEPTERRSRPKTTTIGGGYPQCLGKLNLTT